MKELKISSETLSEKGLSEKRVAGSCVKSRIAAAVGRLCLILIPISVVLTSCSEAKDISGLEAGVASMAEMSEASAAGDISAPETDYESGPPAETEPGTTAAETEPETETATAETEPATAPAETEPVTEAVPVETKPVETRPAETKPAETEAPKRPKTQKPSPNPSRNRSLRRTRSLRRQRRGDLSSRRERRRASSARS